MTSARVMLSLPSFRDSVGQVLDLAEDHASVLRDALTGPTPSNESGISNEDWKRAVSAYRLLWEIASKEGDSDVVEEVVEAFPERSSDSRSALALLLSADERMTEKVRGVRRRDQFLPILADAHFGLDVRLIDAPDEDGPTILAPVITGRFEFDEAVGGSDALVFQLPISQLNELTQQMDRLRFQLKNIDQILHLGEVPSWATEGIDE